jgi:hypothetical protein
LMTASIAAFSALNFSKNCGVIFSSSSPMATLCVFYPNFVRVHGGERWGCAEDTLCTTQICRSARLLSCGITIAKTRSRDVRLRGFVGDERETPGR